MAFEAIKKIAINFAVVFIIASVFSSVAPNQAQKAYAFFEDKLGYGDPTIGYFTATPKDDKTATISYSILGNLKEVDKILVYHKAEIPPQLGEPDKNKIYRYVAAEATPIWYYFYKNGDYEAWLWTPYDPKDNKWETASEDPVVKQEGKWKDKTPVRENVEIIKYLASVNPNPKGGAEVYKGEPSLTDNVAKRLGDNGAINREACYFSDDKNDCIGGTFRGWQRFTIELYVSNGEVPSADATVRVGVPIELGEPEAQGIYTYQAPGASPMYYKYFLGDDFAGEWWMWTPYDPKDNKWMYASENPEVTAEGKWKGKRIADENIEIIKYLYKAKPRP